PWPWATAEHTDQQVNCKSQHGGLSVERQPSLMPIEGRTAPRLDFLLRMLLEHLFLRPNGTSDFLYIYYVYIVKWLYSGYIKGL
ncbi:MAG: hypothetical protein ABSA33_06605, partial [Candidatus Micrarchaeaceae archaeon]